MRPAEPAASAPYVVDLAARYWQLVFADGFDCRSNRQMRGRRRKVLFDVVARGVGRDGVGSRRKKTWPQASTAISLNDLAKGCKCTRELLTKFNGDSKVYACVGTKANPRKDAEAHSNAYTPLLCGSLKWVSVSAKSRTAGHPADVRSNSVSGLSG